VKVDAQPLRELITNREIQVKFSVVVAIAIILFVLWRADAATLFLAASVESLSRWIGLFQVEPGCVVPAYTQTRLALFRDLCQNPDSPVVDPAFLGAP
jgi:hypothetical protein